MSKERVNNQLRKNKMTAEEAKDDEKRHVLVGIRFDEHTKELLNWALVKVADPGDRVVAVHVTRNSGT